MNLTLYVTAALILSIELVFLMDFLLKAHNRNLNVISALLWTVLCCLLTLHCCRNAMMLPFALAVFLPLAIALVLAVLNLKMHTVCRNLHYGCDDNGKATLYAGKKVMLIVPHQDDDMNIASGILEQYVTYGSEVYVVFVTNGDYWNIAEVRLTEAIRALQSIGIPEDHVIFLGYADGWESGTAHIYNSPAGTVCKSRNGYTATYALKSHPAWNEGSPYTSDNLLRDIASVILAHRPDTILCSDYDPHVEHKATTLAFEKAMGRILKQDCNYRPVVLKACAYCTAWTARKDFPALNLRSTYDPGDQISGIYRWADRIRFPVDGSKLSRSLRRSELYTPICLYQSQRAGIAAASIINGDKVFWQRRTDSVLHRAHITVSSGNGEKLNDFMLLDSYDLFNSDHQPYDNVWVPEAEDREKTVRITLDAPLDIAELVLYDSPSPTDNILNARVVFDNGYCFDTGTLNQNGNASSFAVNQKGVRTFTVTLLETEGACAGLCEIEAFGQPNAAPFSFIKLMDMDGHFAYDYAVDESGTEALQLYTFGSAAALSPGAYKVVCDHAGCSAEISGDRLLVHCLRGAACNVTITSLEDAGISDSILVRNPYREERKKIIRAQYLEEFFHRRAHYISKQTNLCIFLRKSCRCVRGVLYRCKRHLLSRFAPR